MILSLSLESDYYEKRDIAAAQKAIEIYEGLLKRSGFDFLKERIEHLERVAGLA